MQREKRLHLIQSQVYSVQQHDAATLVIFLDDNQHDRIMVTPSICGKRLDVQIR